MLDDIMNVDVTFAQLVQISDFKDELNKFKFKSSSYKNIKELYGALTRIKSKYQDEYQKFHANSNQLRDKLSRQYVERVTIYIEDKLPSMDNETAELCKEILQSFKEHKTFNYINQELVSQYTNTQPELVVLMNELSAQLNVFNQEHAHKTFTIERIDCTDIENIIFDAMIDTDVELSFIDKIHTIQKIFE